VIVDTSAVVAVLKGEPEASAYTTLMLDATTRMSAAGYLEAGIVIDGAGDPAFSRRLDELLRITDTGVEPVTFEQARVAREAYRGYGRGSGHPARLNFGDCFSYALALATGEPLLFKGDDFVHTDLSAAPQPPGG
jgi:ribonuclease VapC